MKQTTQPAPTETASTRYSVLLQWPLRPHQTRAETFYAIVDAPSVSLAVMLARQCCTLANPEALEGIIMHMPVLLVTQGDNADLKFQAPLAVIRPD
jgi:hypothetical protein